MSFIFLSVLASSLANLKFLFLSICYILPFFQWTFPCWQPPRSCRPVSLSFGIAKIDFFHYMQHTQQTFFLFFLHFLCNILITNEIKLHFYWQRASFLVVFLGFLASFGVMCWGNFADFWHFAVKIEFLIVRRRAFSGLKSI